jgi:hypothetical protein
MATNRKPKPLQKAPSTLTIPQYKRRGLKPEEINFPPLEENVLESDQLNADPYAADLDTYADVSVDEYIKPPPQQQKPKDVVGIAPEEDNSLDDKYWLFIVNKGERNLLFTTNDEKELKMRILRLVGAENVDIANIRVFKNLDLEFGVILEQ